MASPIPKTSSTTTLVICTDPPELTMWLSPVALRHLDLVEPDELDVQPLDGPATSGGNPAARRTVRLPLDGPDSVLPLAAAGLRKHLAGTGPSVTVIADGPGGLPPTADQLGALARSGLPLGVDLTACPWVTDTDVFLITRFGAARVPVRWGATSASGDLARTLLATGQTEPGSPLHRWLHRTTRSFAAAGAEDWATALQVLYLDSLVGELDPRHRRGPL